MTTSTDHLLIDRRDPTYYSVINTYVVGHIIQQYIVITVSTDGLEALESDILILFGDGVPTWWRGWWWPAADYTYDSDGSVDVRVDDHWPLSEEPPDKTAWDTYDETHGCYPVGLVS